MTIYTLLVSGFMPTAVPVGPPNIGDAYEGGYYVGEISTAGNGVADYRLVIAPKSTETSGVQWGGSGTATGATSQVDGPANSATIAAAIDPSAAKSCENLTTGGYTDWYLPAYLELEIAYYNLKPTTNANSTVGYGPNAYAVPPRASAYTAGVPPQTSVALFQEGGSEAFVGTIGTSYWTSTESNASFAWAFRFADGSYNNFSSKNNGLRVRAMRRVAI